MSNTITISRDDLFHQVKLSCQIPSLVEGIITRKVILSAATEAGIKIETGELQEAADKLRLISKLTTSESTLEWLQKNCLSVDDFEEIVYTNLVSGKLAELMFGNKVEAWFYEHQLDYAGAVIYEVILDDEDVALDLFYSLQEGEITFAEVAKEYIQDKELRRRGGYRGMVNRREMKPEISAAVFASQAHQLLKPVMTSKGVHLIWVDEVIQPKLDERLRYQILSELFGEWVKKRVEELEVMTELN